MTLTLLNNVDVQSIQQQDNSGTIYLVILQIFYGILLLLIAEFLNRCIQLTIEFYFYQKHYMTTNKSINIVKRVFSFNTKTIYCFSIFTTLISIVFFKDNLFWENIFDQKISIIPSYIIFKLIGIDYSELEIAKMIRSGSGCDYATGMASSFFHGYININIPGKNGIRERIKDYEDSEIVQFPIKKLFITVPNSMHTKPIFRSEILDKADAELKVVVKDRAGVKRPYKNDVYRFKKKVNNKNYYIAVEGATPLLSFYESLQSNLTRTPVMVAMQREILLQFYNCIKKYSEENKETNNEIEFVYYDDYVNGKEVDVGEVLLQRIADMLEKNNY